MARGGGDFPGETGCVSLVLWSMQGRKHVPHAVPYTLSWANAKWARPILGYPFGLVQLIDVGLLDAHYLRQVGRSLSTPREVPLAHAGDSFSSPRTKAPGLFSISDQ